VLIIPGSHYAQFERIEIDPFEKDTVDFHILAGPFERVMHGVSQSLEAKTATGSGTPQQAKSSSRA
jgi:hypothetical protein